MTETISKTMAIKEYMGTTRPVENAELLKLRKEDPEGFDEMGIACAKMLGKEIAVR